VTGVLTARQVDQFHQHRPGITEDLMLRMRDEAGATPYEWLAAAVRGLDPVLDVGCGSAPLADHLGSGYLGLDRSEAELARAARTRPAVALLCGDALRLPLGGRFAGVTASMALMLVAPLEAVLAEVARVVVRGGVVAATLPALVGDADTDGKLHAAVLARLRRAGVTYPEALAPDGLAARFAACGLRLAADEERCFSLPLRGNDDLRLLVESYYSPDASHDDRVAAETLVRSAVGDTGEVGYRLRRLVAART